MTDLALNWIDAAFGADLALDAGSLVTDDGLRTAVIISLFTDARAAIDDPLPQPAADRRGWWGDMLAAVASDEYGSKLWMLAREKQLPSILRRAEDYAGAALAWMVDDEVAAKIDVTASFPHSGWLGLEVTIHRPTGPARQRFDFAWNATELSV